MDFDTLREFGNLLERRELSIQFGHRLLQHLAMAGVTGCLELPGQTFAGKKQAVTFAVAVLIVRRERSAGRLLPL